MAIQTRCLRLLPLLAVSALQLSGGEPPVGKTLFDSSCAGCHGLDGRGGEHAPNIASSNKGRVLTDRDLVRIVRFGIPSAGMPAFDVILSRDAITTVVAYLRILQAKGQQAPSPGSPQRGRELFVGAQARCSSCHMVNGAGGFLGADLSGYGQIHNAAEIRDAILNPVGRADPQGNRVTVFTKNGSVVSGLLRNEDNFSLQLQTEDSAFALLAKSSVARIDRSSNPIMPSDYGALLTKTQIDDLVSYLASL